MIDASVAIKWVVLEPGRAAARVWLDAFGHGERLLVGPSLLGAEVASTLARKERRRLLSSNQAREAWRMFEIFTPMLYPVEPLLASAFELALRHEFSLSDAIYLALAIDRRSELVTADRRFFTASSRAFPFVRWYEDD